MKVFSVILGAFLTSVSLAESITTIVTATKDGHVYTKTVTQDATFVWQGEESSSETNSSAAASSTAGTSSSADATSSAVTSSSADATSAENTTAPTSASASEESITTTVTATKDGHVYTKTVTQAATFVWEGEGSYSSASSPTFNSESSISTLAAVSTSAYTSSTTASVSNYTGGAAVVAAGSGLFGAAIFAILI